jgi:hypothetical protein
VLRISGRIEKQVPALLLPFIGDTYLRKTII